MRIFLNQILNIINKKKNKESDIVRNKYEMAQDEFDSFMKEKQIDIDLAAKKSDIRRINEICDEMNKIKIIY